MNEIPLLTDTLSRHDLGVLVNALEDHVTDQTDPAIRNRYAALLSRLDALLLDVLGDLEWR